MSNNISFYHERENIYVNLSLYNNTLKDIPANLEINIEKLIVERADEYRMSVIRFTCPLYNVPRYFQRNMDFRFVIVQEGNTQIKQAVLPLNPVQSIYTFI
jgi:hypothetical protein